MSHFAFLPGIPSSSASARTCFSRAPPRAQLHRFEAPSTNKSHRLHWLSPVWTAWAATGTMTRRHDPASDMRSRSTRGALDSDAYRLFTGAPEPHAACQLLQRSVPRARQRTVQTPESRGEPPLSERRQPFRFAADRAFSGQGSLGLLNRVDPHWKRPLAPADLPRPNRLGHPMSRNRARLNVERVNLAALRCWASYERSRPEHRTRTRCSF